MLDVIIETVFVFTSLQNTEHFAMLGLGDIVSNIVDTLSVGCAMLSCHS